MHVAINLRQLRGFLDREAEVNDEYPREVFAVEEGADCVEELVWKLGERGA